MADITRRFVDILKEVWAEKAQTTIPTRPISGMAYRDPDAEFSTGQQFDSLGESSRWNQALYLLSGLIMEVARFGICLLYTSLSISIESNKYWFFFYIWTFIFYVFLFFSIEVFI